MLPLYKIYSVGNALSHVVRHVLGRDMAWPWAQSWHVLGRDMAWPWAQSCKNYFTLTLNL